MATNPFAQTDTKVYHLLANDVYHDGCILSFRTALLDPGPLAQSNAPVLSTQFLLGAYIKDDDGNKVLDEAGIPIIGRKWTRWVRVSYAPRAALMSLFDTSATGFTNLPDILQSFDSSEGRLWNTPVKFILEQSDKYQNIIRIKPGTKTELVKELYYDDKYVPYKVVKAYGKLTSLECAGCKFKNGVKIYTPDDMIQPDESAS